MRIIIYTRNDCVQCHATKRAMESRGVSFEMVNVDWSRTRQRRCVTRGSASFLW